jgi:hypothetical protein
MADGRGKRPATALAIAFAVLVAGCGGGSGSTGLIVPENALLREVRRNGTCATSGEVTYCATDSSEAVAPDGQTAIGPPDVNGSPTPCPVDQDPCSRDNAGFVVSGFDPGAACASALRPAGSEDPWTTGPLVPVGGPSTQVAVSFPADFPLVPVETALLCFAAPPPSLPARLATLAEAGPDVVFVPRDS